VVCPKTWVMLLSCVCFEVGMDNFLSVRGVLCGHCDLLTVCSVAGILE